MQMLQERVSSGFAQVARRIGRMGRQYRVTDPLTPLGHAVGAPYLCLDVDAGFRMRKPKGWGQVMTLGLSDARDLAIGDYIALDERFYFVAEMEPCRPALFVACNREISVMGMRGAEKLLADRCPASLWMTGKGEDRHSGMPGAMRSGSYMLHLPVMPGFCLKPYMQVMDEKGARYLVDTVELSQNGTRALLSMQQV